jgi:aminopeptidase-like protein
MSQSGALLDRLLDTGSGAEMYALAEELYPVCRSITGNGLRTTLNRIAEDVPLELSEVPSGTEVFDWTVPKEWNIRDAWIKDPAGRKIVDFRDNNLHVVSYSVPVHRTLALEALRPHLHTLPEHPDWIPYRTNYYSENWGFCLAHSVFEQLEEGEYEVFVDSSLGDGALTYGECLIAGSSEEEVLLSAHTCHPSLANDNLSGISLLTRLGRALQRASTRYSYRLIFAPGTIGSIAWLARNREKAGRIRHGLVVSCVGDGGGPMYKKSRIGDAEIDKAMCRVLSDTAPEASIEDFSPYGYDERQYCSPGFNLPVGLFERSKYGAFPEYHTSADNLDFISAEELDRSYGIVCRAIDILETNRAPVNVLPHCEPQLGKRGLYEAMGGDNQRVARQMAMLWVLNLADGEHSLLDMAERSGVPFSLIRDMADVLEAAGLLGIQSHS